MGGWVMDGTPKSGTVVMKQAHYAWAVAYHADQGSRYIINPVDFES